MEGTRFIETICLENILSYGPGNAPVPLEPLNVLIGPNGSGKSNLFEAMSLLAATPRDLQQPIREGGGVGNWLWKGSDQPPAATLAVALQYSGIRTKYSISFTERTSQFRLLDEVIEDGSPTATTDKQPDVHYRYQQGRPVLAVKGETLPLQLGPEELSPEQSILSQRRDPASYPLLSQVSTIFSSLIIYRDWALGHNATPRFPQKPDSFQSVLLRDSSNLALVLSDLLNRPLLKEQILDHMRGFYPSINDVFISVSGGTVQIFFHEKGLHHPIPATRLSDGSLRYLSLLAVLCHPNPPLVICIEEPELGLHPDVIPEVAKLLVEASSRRQIFVTTHSDVLVDALTDVPEAVIVCEKIENGTQLRRLNAEELKPWLERYRLGQLWSRGQIGGNRW